MNFVTNLLIVWPKKIASHFEWAGPLVARIVVGYTFMLTLEAGGFHTRNS